MIQEFWIARNKINLKLILFEIEPEKYDGYFDTKARYAHEIDYGLFLHEVTYENSPRKVKIELI